MPTRPDLTELERLLAEATAGPWQVDEATTTGQRATVAFPVVLSESTGEILLEGDYGGGANAALIVATVNALPFLLAEARKAETLEAALRREWWLNHGHDFHALYGDDGEMQCSQCPADFKRQPLDELRTYVVAA